MVVLCERGRVTRGKTFHVYSNVGIDASKGILCQKDSPLHPGSCCRFGQSEVRRLMVLVLINQNRDRSYKHALDVCADNKMANCAT